MATRSRDMTPGLSSAMHLKIVATRAANENRRRAENEHRLNDPLERAKTYLRSRGYHVFAESVLEGVWWRSTNIRVGQNSLTADEVIAMADRIRAR